MVDELAYHIFIQATAQDVWDALTGPNSWPLSAARPAAARRPRSARR
jgi:hypothetical protein